MKKLVFLLAAFTLLAAPSMAQRFGGGGTPVAVSGDEVYASSRSSSTPGSLDIYTRSDDGSWSATGTISASDAMGPDGFGSAVVVAGETMAVGAPSAGKVYIFTRSEDGSWSESGQVSNDAEGFGRAIALNRDILVVGAPVGFRSENTGSAFAYVRNESGDFELSTQLIAEGVAARGQYGSVVATGGGRAVVGEPGANSSTGTVHAFNYDGDSGEWTSAGNITNPGLAEGNRFGSSLLIAGSHMAVGVPGYENRIGAVIVFKLDDEGAWEFDERIAPFSARGGESFGSSLTFANNALWVGAPGHNGGMGAIFKFEPNDSRLNKTWLMAPTDMQARAGFGGAIAANNQVAVVNAPRYDNGEGAFIPYANVDGTWVQGNAVWKENQTHQSITGGQIECQNGMAGDFPCADVDMVSFLTVQDMGGERGIRTNDIWGWTHEPSGREFAIVGMSNKSSFVEVTDAANPEFKGTLMMTEGANSAVWRDMKVYKDHAYIVSDGAGPHGVQVFDLSLLLVDRPEPVEFEAETVYHGIASAHNIVINEDTGFAYVVGSRGGGETCGGGLHMLDLSSPKEPTFAGCFADETTGRRKTGYSHDAQCVIYHGPDTEYQGHEICLGSNEDALSIADVTDKENPVALSMASYPAVAYAHQGWLTDDHRYFYMNDEGDEPQQLVAGTRTLIWDVTDLDEPQLAGEHIAETKDTDHNLYIKGDLMYQSNYGAGFRVLDISNRENPVEVAYFDTNPDETGGGDSSWSNYPYFKSGAIVVTGGAMGLFVVKKKEVDI